MSDDPLVVLPLPGGGAAAFTAEQVLEAEKRAQRLGFGIRTQQGRELNSPEKLLDSRELGVLFGCDSTTIESMARGGRLPSVRIGRLLRFQPSLCLAALRVNDGRL